MLGDLLDTSRMLQFSARHYSWNLWSIFVRSVKAFSLWLLYNSILSLTVSFLVAILFLFCQSVGYCATHAFLPNDRRYPCTTLTATLLGRVFIILLRIGLLPSLNEISLVKWSAILLLPYQSIFILCYFFLWRRSCFDGCPTKLLSKSLLLLWLQSIIFTGTRPCFYIIIQGLISLCNFHFRRCFLRVFLIILFVPLLLFFQGLIIKPYLCQFRIRGNSRASFLLLQTALLPGSPLFTTLLMRIFCYFTMCLLVFCLIKVFYFVLICNFAAVL